MDQSLLKDLGLPTFYTLLTLFFKQKQDDQHREDLKGHKAEMVTLALRHKQEIADRDSEYFNRLAEMRQHYSDRQDRQHERNNQLTERLLTTIAENTRVITAMVTVVERMESD